MTLVDFLLVFFFFLLILYVLWRFLHGWSQHKNRRSCHKKTHNHHHNHDHVSSTDEEQDDDNEENVTAESSSNTNQAANLTKSLVTLPRSIGKVISGNNFQSPHRVETSKSTVPDKTPVENVHDDKNVIPSQDKTKTTSQGFKSDLELFRQYVCNWKDKAVRALPGFHPIPDSISKRLSKLFRSSSSKLPTSVPPASVFFSPKDVNANVPLLQVFFGVGINYYGTSNELPTCNNDLFQTRKWWRKRVAVSTRVVEYILTDLPSARSAFDGQVTLLTPTVRNWHTAASSIVTLLRDQAAKGGQSELVCYTSCHGFYQLTTSNLENDLYGRCECIVMTDGFVWDYEAFSELIDRLPPQTHFLGLADECHAGSFWNLPLSVNRLSGACSLENRNSGISALCWSFSGSLDNETAAAGHTSRDMSVFTASFLRLMQRSSNERIPISQLMTEFFKDLRGKKQAQTPLLSVSDASLAAVPLFA